MLNAAFAYLGILLLHLLSAPWIIILGMLVPLFFVAADKDDKHREPGLFSNFCRFLGLIGIIPLSPW